MEFYKKYQHIGISYPSVPSGWVEIVKLTIIEIEKKMWPQWWLPLFGKRWIHYLATGNSVVRIRSHFWYRIRSRLTKGRIVTDIKDKFATLRIYGCFGSEIEGIVEAAEQACSQTCERCGSRESVSQTDSGWIYNLCKECLDKQQAL